MLRRIGDRVELHVTDQRARGVTAGDVDFVLARLPAGALQLAQHRARVERDKGEVLLPIDDGEDLAHHAGPLAPPLPARARASASMVTALAMVLSCK